MIQLASRAAFDWRRPEEKVNMADFNLQTLYNFRPAQYLCQNCCGLLAHAPVPKKTPTPSVLFVRSSMFRVRSGLATRSTSTLPPKDSS